MIDDVFNRHLFRFRSRLWLRLRCYVRPGFGFHAGDGSTAGGADRVRGVIENMTFYAANERHLIRLARGRTGIDRRVGSAVAIWSRGKIAGLVGINRSFGQAFFVLVVAFDIGIGDIACEVKFWRIQRHVGDRDECRFSLV